MRSFVVALSCLVAGACQSFPGADIRPPLTELGAPADACSSGFWVPDQGADPPDTPFVHNVVTYASGRPRREGQNQQRCDISSFAFAVAADGFARDIYGPSPIRSGGGFNDSMEAHRESYYLDAIRNAREVIFAIERAALASAGTMNAEGSSASDVGQSASFQILMHVHGGMVSHHNAVRAAEALAPAMMSDGYHPIFLIWNSDFPDAYVNHLCCVNSRGEGTRLYQRPRIATRLLADFGGSIFSAPDNFYAQAERFNASVLSDNDPRYRIPEQLSGLPGQSSHEDSGVFARQTRYLVHGRISIDMSPATERRELHRSPQVRLPLTTELEEANWQSNTPLQRQAQWALFWPARTAATTLFINSGASAWDNMVRRTRLAVRSGDLAPPVEAGPLSPGARTCAEYWSIDESGEDRWYRDGVPHPSLVGLGGTGVFIHMLQCRLKLHEERREPVNNKVISSLEFEFPGNDVDEYNHRLCFSCLPELPEIAIDLSAHSMGTIIANDIIGQFGRDLPLRRIIYMGAATSIRDFRLSFAAMRERPRHPDDAAAGIRPDFYNLMLHPLAESRELSVQGWIPQGSLLEWIDEHFEGPRDQDERMLGKWSNVWRAWPSLENPGLSRLVFRVFPVPADDDGNRLPAASVDGEPCAVRDRPCYPVAHGQFEHFTFWRDGFLGGYCTYRGADRPPPDGCELLSRPVTVTLTGQK